MSEGTASAQRINEALDIQESQRRFMESVSDADEPMTRRDLILLSLYWLASCALVGLAFYCAVMFAEAVR